MKRPTAKIPSEMEDIVKAVSFASAAEVPQCVEEWEAGIPKFILFDLFAKMSRYSRPRQAHQELTTASFKGHPILLQAKRTGI